MADGDNVVDAEMLDDSVIDRDAEADTVAEALLEVVAVTESVRDTVADCVGLTDCDGNVSTRARADAAQRVAWLPPREEEALKAPIHAVWPSKSGKKAKNVALCDPTVIVIWL